MKTTRNLWIALPVALLLAIPFIAKCQDQIPAAINYQGHLTDNLGNELASGYYEIEFRIWDDATSTAAASLVWGRTFPLHVVDGGLFNILLSDDGGEVTSPGTPQFNDIRQAFGGEDRYLGLTITVDPSGTITSPSEISPRQQLASAPYAIQSQTANSVRNLGVTSAALANNAVTTAKLNNAAVTSAKIANSAVTTSQIANGAVTSAKLNISGDVHLNNHALLLSTDTSAGLKHVGTFAGETYDGPALFGSTKGVLGTTSEGEKAALSWDHNGGVSLFGIPQDLSAGLPGIGDSKTYTAAADGIVVLYMYGETWYIQIYKGGNTGVFVGKDDNSPSSGGAVMNSTPQGDAYGKVFMWPIRSGDKIELYRQHSHTTDIHTEFYFYPFGVSRSNSMN